jgi:large subunit ribosomal protein L30
MAKGKTIEIKQTGSTLRRPPIQEKTLRGLGLKRIGHVVTVQDTPEVRGMVKAVAHLIEITE